MLDSYIPRMIVFDLACEDGHRFEGWFASSGDFATQHATGLVSCPQCGSREVAKAPMAPAVPRKGNRAVHQRPTKPTLARGAMPPQVAQALNALAAAQHKALEDSTWVGEDFADVSRAMHYGERDVEAIHGRAEVAQALELIEEGIAVAPLPFPIAPPDELN